MLSEQDTQSLAWLQWHWDSHYVMQGERPDPRRLCEPRGGAFCTADTPNGRRRLVVSRSLRSADGARIGLLTAETGPALVLVHCSPSGWLVSAWPEWSDWR